MHAHELRVEVVDWSDHGDICLDIRFEVFVKEQRVPPEIEADGQDAAATHVLAWAAGMPVGTGRLLPDGKIGRMAVRTAFRHQGIGGRLMAQLLAAARHQGHAEVHLSAQTQVSRFYEDLGFSVCGEPFIEAGIDHVPMRKNL